MSVEPRPGFDIDGASRFEAARTRASEYFGAARPSVLSHGKELLIGGVIGFSIRNGVQFGMVAIGAQGLPIVIASGAAAGAGVSFWKERNRVGNFRDIDYGVVARGAAIGAAGGLLGAFLREAWDGTNLDLPGAAGINQGLHWVGDRFSDLGRNASGLLGRPTTFWDGGWHLPGTTPPEYITPTPTQVVVQPTAIPTLEPGPNPTAQPTGVPKPGIVTTAPETGPSVPIAGDPAYVATPKVPEGLNLAEKVAALKGNHDLNLALQAEVYEKVVTEDQIISEALKAHGKSVSLSDEQLVKVKESLQRVIEAKGNYAMDQTVRYWVMDHQFMDVSDQGSIEKLKEAQQYTFNDIFKQPTTHAELVGIAEHSIALELTPPSPQSAAEEITKFVADNQNNPEIFVDHIVGHGETAGHLIKEMGITPTWDGTDLHGFAALWFSNPGVFKDIATGMGLTPEELLKLVQQAQDGDELAYRKVYKSMSFIREGTNLKIPTRMFIQHLAA